VKLKWLEWARQIQAISQTGLAYSKDVYDLERFEALRELSLEIMNEYTGVEVEQIRTLFASDTGYATPKVDIRGVIIDERDRLLLVKERSDGAWALPGGWAEVGLSPKEVVVKEVKEESGLDVRPVRLLGILDKKLHEHPPAGSYVYKIFIQCEEIGGQTSAGVETSEVGWFAEDELPDLSAERNTLGQIKKLFAMHRIDDGEVMLD
jgi:ADP-ribose pyrophosphatase YjhB (NUDIX family)